jgi:probable F420-dependent oxidoreductase
MGLADLEFTGHRGTAMKVGAFGVHMATSPDVAILASKAEELGYDSFWVPEHMAVPASVGSQHPRRFEDPNYRSGSIPDVYWQVPDPFVALGAAATATKTIRLGTAVCLVPQYKPLHLAKLVTSIDFYSRGRFDLGIGTGWLQEEGEVMGVDWEHRWTQAKEALMAMNQVWSNPIGEHHGHYYDFPPIRMEPRPIQQPHPPIYIGGKPPHIMQRLVDLAQGWLAPRMTVDDVRAARKELDELSAAAGRPPEQRINISVFGLPENIISREVASAFEEAGADRLVPWLTHSRTDELIHELEQNAHLLMG